MASVSGSGFKTSWTPTNKKVDKLPDREGFVKSNFQLEKSPRIIAFENGTYPGHPEHWESFVFCSNLEKDQWCDVQVNYQISLRYLYDNLDVWISA